VHFGLLFFISAQNLAKSASSVPVSSQSSDSYRSERNSEAIANVMQNAGVSRSEAVQALLENFNEPLTAVIVRQPSDPLQRARA
jgi:hypothetical protein